MIRRAVVLLLIAVQASGCAPIRSVLGRVFPDQAERWAREVVIRRDEWGVPHISGPTDASVVFGLSYAMAEDNLWQVEEDVVRSIGRTAELHGEAGLADDLVRAALEVERLSREEYEREPEERRALWDAWAEGYNYYLRVHPGVRTRLLVRFEPWQAFARFRSGSAGTRIDGVRLGDVLVEEVTPAATSSSSAAWTSALAIAPRAALPEERLPGEDVDGSNAWAVSPARTASGHALLFQNPHVSWFGGGQRYEASLRSDEGYHVGGFAILGTPLIRTGHNESLGWTHTNTAADDADAWVVQFPDPTLPAYRYDGGTRDAVEWERDIRVRADSGFVTRRFRFRKTHRGPVIRTDGGYADVRIARFEDGGSLQQWHAMGRATDLDAFRAALAQTAFPISNTMYADTAGNILFVQGNAVPRRTASVDPTRPLDGADPRTEWDGYHALEELPQLLNPESGWLQNANATPFLATADGANLDAADYPAYMAPEPDNARARVSREILAANDAWTFDAWAAAAFDRRMVEPRAEVPAIIDEWQRLGATDPEQVVALDAAVEALQEWDGISSEQSAATTLFVLWFERYRREDGDTAAFRRLRILGEVVQELRADWETELVPWGEVNRVQRVHTSGTEPFDDDAPSLPTAGAPGWTGIVFNVTGREGPGRRRYGVSGDTWVGIVEFAPRPITRSIVTFGQSADPASPHWFDQAPLFVDGRFKTAWFWPEDVEQHGGPGYTPAEAGVQAQAQAEAAR